MSDTPTTTRSGPNTGGGSACQASQWMAVMHRTSPGGQWTNRRREGAQSSGAQSLQAQAQARAQAKSGGLGGAGWAGWAGP